MENFKCPKCLRKFTIPKYKIAITPFGSIYKAEGNQLLCNDLTHSMEALVPIEKEGEYTVAMGSSKVEGKNKMVNYLKKRSKDHFKKDIAPIKAAMLRQSTTNQ